MTVESGAESQLNIATDDWCMKGVDVYGNASEHLTSYFLPITGCFPLQTVSSHTHQPGVHRLIWPCYLHLFLSGVWRTRHSHLDGHYSSHYLFFSSFSTRDLEFLSSFELVYSLMSANTTFSAFCSF